MKQMANYNAGITGALSCCYAGSWTAMQKKRNEKNYLVVQIKTKAFDDVMTKKACTNNWQWILPTSYALGVQPRRGGIKRCAEQCCAVRLTAEER